jgi:hypothetical protein
VIKVDGQEMYKGKFYSMASSSSCAGVVILESLFKLDNTHNMITINYGYPSPGFAEGKDPRDNPPIISCFQKQGLLK